MVPDSAAKGCQQLRLASGPCGVSSCSPGRSAPQTEGSGDLPGMHIRQGQGMKELESASKQAQADAARLEHVSWPLEGRRTPVQLHGRRQPTRLGPQGRVLAERPSDDGSKCCFEAARKLLPLSQAACRGPLPSTNWKSTPARIPLSISRGGSRAVRGIDAWTAALPSFSLLTPVDRRR